MESKIETLYHIYSIVKDNPNPIASLIPPNEIVLKQTCPWDEVVKNLNQLQIEGHINMNQLSTILISITEKGLTFIKKDLSIYGI